MVLRPTSTVSSYVFGKEFSYGICYWYAGFLGWLNLGARVFYSGHRRQRALDRKRKEEALKVRV